MVNESSVLPAGPAHAHNRISDGGASTAGLQRAQNEDAHSRPPAGASQSTFGSLYALADGVGSRPDGAAASWLAAHLLQAVYYAPAGAAQPGDRLRAAVEAVNVLTRALRRAPGGNGETRASRPEAEPLTTLVAAVVHNDRLWVANVGDSRAYLVHARTRQCQPLTEDHSQTMPVPSAPPAAPQPPADWPPAADPDATRRNATIQRTQPQPPVPAKTPALASAPPRALTRAIGLEEHCQVDIYTYAWQEGDRLILCSDGLDAVPLEAMAEMVLGAAPDDAAERLVSEAVTRDGSDNATALVVAWRRRRARAARRRAASRGWGQLVAITLVAVLLGIALGLLGAVLLSIYYTGGLF